METARGARDSPHLPFRASPKSLDLGRSADLIQRCSSVIANRERHHLPIADCSPHRWGLHWCWRYPCVQHSQSGACTVCMRVRGDRWLSSLRLRLLLPILIIYPVCLLALQGCAGLAVAESTAMVDWQPPTNVPMTIRTLNADSRFSQVSSIAAAERLRALHPGEPLNILALSGGGADGAFGAGAVAGLTLTGSRPDFTVVTGVSVGALVAPYAFLGPRWDARPSRGLRQWTGRRTCCNHEGSA